MKNRLLILLLVTIVIGMCSTAILAQKKQGTFTDKRDGHTYKWVRIGNQAWMAENLNYKTNSDSWCYDNDTSNCQKYGRLYTWEMAKEVCPAGWHLPGDNEWEELAQFISNDKGPYTKDKYGWEDVGKHLKAKRGWEDGGNGTDAYRFSALPGGYPGDYTPIGHYGYFWSSIGYDNEHAWGRALDCNTSRFHRHRYDKGYGFSVRCVRDLTGKLT